MAGVPVLVAGGTWTASLVEEHAIGEVVEPWTGEALAAAIQRVVSAPPADRAARRQAVRRTALERLSWDVELERLVGLFRGLA
jgi:glycosyltransferase involved in cell wall biosynthesis